jgi:hypothetical protein
VARLVDEYLPAGMHQSVFEGANLPSGIYFARLSTPVRDLVQKLILIK